jgi:hypothetical protein
MQRLNIAIDPTTCVGVVGKESDTHKSAGKGKSKAAYVHGIVS